MFWATSNFVSSSGLTKKGKPLNIMITVACAQRLKSIKDRIGKFYNTRKYQISVQITKKLALS